MAPGGRELQQEMMVEEENDERLKYLEFFHTAVLGILIFISNLYNHAKEKSGPFKPGVKCVEKIVKVMVRPVYDDIIAVFMELLKFIDNKMDKAVVKLDRGVPPILKQTLTAAHKAPAAALQAIVYDMIKRKGATLTATGILKSMYNKYEPDVQRYVVWMWCMLNKFTLFQQVAKMAVPTVGYCMEKYNNYVSANYLPLVPTDKIVMVFMGDEAAESVRVWRRFCAPRTCFSFFA